MNACVRTFLQVAAATATSCQAQQQQHQSLEEGGEGHTSVHVAFRPGGTLQEARSDYDAAAAVLEQQQAAWPALTNRIRLYRPTDWRSDATHATWASADSFGGAWLDFSASKPCSLYQVGVLHCPIEPVRCAFPVGRLFDNCRPLPLVCTYLGCLWLVCGVQLQQLSRRVPLPKNFRGHVDEFIAARNCEAFEVRTVVGSIAEGCQVELLQQQSVNSQCDDDFPIKPLSASLHALVADAASSAVAPGWAWAVNLFRSHAVCSGGVVAILIRCVASGERICARSRAYVVALVGH